MLSRTRLFVLALALGLAAVSATPTLAAKDRGGTSSGITVTISPAGPYSFGEGIYVTTDDPIYANNAGPWIELQCFQNGVLVASGDHAGFADGWYYNWPFYLGPTQSWSGGSANCTVTVFHTSNNRTITDATTSFSVNG